MVPNIHFGAVGVPAQPAPQPEPADLGDVSSRPCDLPPDLPDEVEAKLTFTTRRKAEALPSLRPAPQSNALDPSWCKRLARADWHRGFRAGVVATVGGFCLTLTVIVVLAK